MREMTAAAPELHMEGDSDGATAGFSKGGAAREPIAAVRHDQNSSKPVASCPIDQVVATIGPIG